MTFRARLLLTSLATLAVGLAALVVAGNVLLAVRVGTERTDLLREQAQTQIAALDVTANGVRARESANDLALDRSAWIFDGRRVVERPAGAPASLDRLAIEMGRERRDAEREGPADVRLLARAVAPRGGGATVGAVVVARSGAGVETLQQEVLIGSIAIALLVLAAGALAIRSGVDGALRPVVQMTASAEDWSAHDLDRRFSLGPARDEITGLATTLDHMLGRIAASRRHEQRFAGEVAHELRTPIAGLRGRAELALAAEGPDRESQHVDALRSVIQQVDRVQAAVDALLAEARRDLDVPPGSVDVGALVREYEDVEVTAPAELPPAEGETELVRRILAPLVDNARRHSRTQVTIDVSHTDDWLLVAVCDDGDGLDPALLERVFEPGARGKGAGAGAGLGLPLARRLARTCGGDVTAEAGPGGHFVLRLPIQR